VNGALLSGENNTVMHNVTEGGIAADHAPVSQGASLVAPTASADHNTIREPMTPLACWRASDIRFEFESSFVLPGIAPDIDALSALIDRHSATDPLDQSTHKPALTVFGHADPTGNDDFNKALSGRRAQAIYAMLTRRVDLWEDLFSRPVGNDKWNPVALQVMRDTLARPQGATAGNADRSALFRAYMDHLCTVRDPNGEPVQFTLDPADFLAGGDDPLGKGDFQGCGEFNPVLLFSKSESESFAQPGRKTERDAENSPNRRVMVLLFRPGARVRPIAWPCPRAGEGPSGCRKRFWSDAARRRQFQEERREFKETEDTFACRFYHRLAVRSPCETTPKPPLVFALFDVIGNERDRNVELIVLDGKGREVRRIPGTREVQDAGGFFVFRLDPADLPDPVQLAWQTSEGNRHVAGPCSPFQLQDALGRPDLKTGHDLVGDPPEPPGSTPGELPRDGDPMADVAFPRTEGGGVAEIL
jgi:hypothetical protein